MHNLICINDYHDCDISSLLSYSSSKSSGKSTGHRERSHIHLFASFPVLKFLYVFQALADGIMHEHIKKQLIRSTKLSSVIARYRSYRQGTWWLNHRCREYKNCCFSIQRGLSSIYSSFSTLKQTIPVATSTLYLTTLFLILKDPYRRAQDTAIPAPTHVLGLSEAMHHNQVSIGVLALSFPRISS